MVIKWISVLGSKGDLCNETMDVVIHVNSYSFQNTKPLASLLSYESLNVFVVAHGSGL